MCAPCGGERVASSSVQTVLGCRSSECKVDPFSRTSYHYSIPVHVPVCSEQVYRMSIPIRFIYVLTEIQSYLSISSITNFSHLSSFVSDEVSKLIDTHSHILA